MKPPRDNVLNVSELGTTSNAFFPSDLIFIRTHAIGITIERVFVLAYLTNSREVYMK